VASPGADPAAAAALVGAPADPASDDPASAAMSIRRYEEEQRLRRDADPGARSARKSVGRGDDPAERDGGLVDALPDWVGYGFLYSISFVPVFITIAAVAVLFVNSLQ